METKNKSKIGIEKFNKLFELKNELKTQIEDYNNKKTIINLGFINFSSDKKVYKKIKFRLINKEFLITEKNDIVFEYAKDKYPYKNEISEKIILYSEDKEDEYLINIKRHHENYYTICTDIENEKTYSLELVFFFKDSKDKFENIIINNIKLVAK